MVTQVFQSTLGTGIRKLRLADVVNLLEEFADAIACVPNDRDGSAPTWVPHGGIRGSAKRGGEPRNGEARSSQFLDRLELILWQCGGIEVRCHLFKPFDKGVVLNDDIIKYSFRFHFADNSIHNGDRRCNHGHRCRSLLLSGDSRLKRLDQLINGNRLGAPAENDVVEFDCRAAGARTEVEALATGRV